MTELRKQTVYHEDGLCDQVVEFLFGKKGPLEKGVVPVRMVESVEVNTPELLLVLPETWPEVPDQVKSFLEKASAHPDGAEVSHGGMKFATGAKAVGAQMGVGLGVQAGGVGVGVGVGMQAGGMQHAPQSYGGGVGMQGGGAPPMQVGPSGAPPMQYAPSGVGVGVQAGGVGVGVQAGGAPPMQYAPAGGTPPMQATPMPSQPAAPPMQSAPTGVAVGVQAGGAPPPPAPPQHDKRRAHARSLAVGRLVYHSQGAHRAAGTPAIPEAGLACHPLF
eukprot:CAMPEP_0177646314 /NCGR_PEP_ID=MMETSP0447-20121125/9709_1 /TAXON_ID=0 /ORGANISM="Stygamoeba regulata, Strain BSH-02190019" /LENGTH=274 /DNA_ID=CAMNT_0019148841 /DNA_START=236 /DNA_END=1061 /DNA_ORIENTATION=+